ncbi:hypothetical protein N2152v2_006874 [Parachlorella kessleri]
MSIFGHGILEEASPGELFPSLLAGSTDADCVPQLRSQPTTLTFCVPGQEVRPPATGNVAGGEGLALLYVTLPPGYPQEACQCRAVSTVLPRQWEADTTAHLQALAIAAASDSRECLFDLLQAAQEQLAAAPAPASGRGSTPVSSVTGAPAHQPGMPLDARASSAAGDSADMLTQRDSGPSRGDDVRLVVLKLDHMQDRRGYCRAVRRWCGELALTGRLILAGSLVCVVLEGAPDDVRECLARWRTRCVDVDSKGRPCKERLMTVVYEESRSHRCFQCFKVLEDLPSLAEVEEVLGQAGLPATLLLVPGGFKASGAPHSVCGSAQPAADTGAARRALVASGVGNGTQPLGSSRSVGFQWTTDSKTTLIYTGAKMAHGELTRDPPAVIAPGTQGLNGGMAESNGVFTGKAGGTEGTFTFAVPSMGLPNPCIVTVNFDNPFSGSNEYSCSVAAGTDKNCGGKVFCSVGNGGGDDAILLTSVWQD